MSVIAIEFHNTRYFKELFSVEQVILDMVNHDNFRQFVMDKVNTKVDVSALEEERERIRKLLRQVIGAKTKLTDIDKLDVMDKHYDRKY